MKLEKFEIQLDRTNATYLAGETVAGTLVVSTERAMTALRIGVKLIGQVRTGWVNKTETKVAVFDSSEEIFNDYFDAMPNLHDISDGALLPQGEHKFRFLFKLPTDLISSVFNENFGWVRYTCNALLKVSDQGFFAQLGGNNEVDVDKGIIIHGLLDLETVPNLRQPANAGERVELVGCCNRQGSLAAQMTVSEQGIMPGESAKIKILVANGGNQRNKTHRQELALWQQISFRSLNRGDMKTFDRKVVRTAVRNRQSKADHGAQQLEFPVPTNLPPTSTTDSGLITVSYFFKLDLGQLELIVPVVLGRLELPPTEKTS